MFSPLSAAKWTDGGSNNGNSSSYIVSPLRHNEVNFKSPKLLLLFTLTFTRIPPVPTPLQPVLFCLLSASSKHHKDMHAHTLLLQLQLLLVAPLKRQVDFEWVAQRGTAHQ